MQLLDFRQGQVRIVREITQDEYQSYRTAARRLRDVGRWRTIIRMVTANRDDFARALIQADTELQSAQTLEAAREAIDFDLNRYLLNFLSAMRLFLDHTETRLKRHHGNNNVAVQAFKARTAEAYDKQFAYRFMYKLRNHAQHCALPIGHVQLQTGSGTSGQRQRSLALAFDVGELLEQGDDAWEASLKAELQASIPLLDVAPLVDNVLAELKAVSETVELAEKPLLITSAEAIVALGKPVVDAGGHPIVGLVKDNQVEMVRLPHEVLSWLGYNIPAVLL